MKNFEHVKPKKCAECHSTSFVPIIEGHPEGILLSLFFQRKISLCGSFAITNGSAIWACAECGEGIVDEAYCYDDKNQALLCAYEQTVQNTFKNHVPVDNDELRRLKGANFLRAFARDFFDDQDCFILERRNDRYQIITFRDSHREIENNSLFTADRFDQMIEFIGEKGRVEFTVRVNKREVSVIAEKQSMPLRIQVTKA